MRSDHASAPEVWRSRGRIGLRLGWWTHFGRRWAQVGSYEGCYWSSRFGSPNGYRPGRTLQSRLRQGDVELVSVRPDDFEGQWWAVHTKSRNEKALARDLDRLGIGCFLPLARVARHRAGRTTQVHLPLFPGYLFMCGEVEDRYAALNTRRAVRVIDVGDQDGFRASLRHIHCMVNSERPVDVYPGIRRGRLVRVARGPLVGLEGVVIRRYGVCRVYVAMDMLGQSAEVEVDGGMLEVID